MVLVLPLTDQAMCGETYHLSHVMGPHQICQSGKLQRGIDSVPVKSCKRLVFDSGMLHVKDKLLNNFGQLRGFCKNERR